MLTAGDRKSRKANGVHYTPEPLANFLARRIWFNAAARFKKRQTLSLLDPACGDGALLQALLKCMSGRQVEVTGFETNRDAAESARQNLASFPNAAVNILQRDFLDFAVRQTQSRFDIVIANPPYVRTQVLGQKKSQRLAAQFDLNGRVDLYQAFLCGITRMIKPLGWFGGLTSNRFLYTQSGKSTRRLLLGEYRLTELYDLGDTRLFAAAVLPAVFVASRNNRTATGQTESRLISPAFLRIKQTSEHQAATDPNEIFGAIENTIAGEATSDSAGQRGFAIEVGRLRSDDKDQVWRLENELNKRWLDQISLNQTATIGEVAEVKVGVKTTADRVFIRDDWQTLPTDRRPESALLRKLINHKTARRWRGLPAASEVLYPYEETNDRSPINLRNFPRSKAYLNQHFERLSGRKYVMAAGREWFEIWVPHRASDWLGDKVVWPDISEQPRFFLDRSGCVVNGDCYWIKLKQEQPCEMLHLILAVANSHVALQFYDYRFHNKLYGRRRRFMTQYVKQFPLPDLASPIGQKIVAAVKRIVNQNSLAANNQLELEIDQMVHQAFGVDMDSTLSTRCP